ncbi:TonB-dependent receptor [Sphingomonas panacisoli]|uniref:TonB-dependent receptor n=1 Tax=Sphingomonas panacisoli TaxID=1813879 RepID=A0A5B8LL15_9SPHN|nr:TonB-dependent receptor [Sphingomonas panacisoli]QDZ08908.1 TonB-dependent receptor [Sphingomonas panacisoli]
MRRSFSLALLLSGVAPTALHAQTTPPAAAPAAPAPVAAPAAKPQAAPTPTPTPPPADDGAISDEPDIIVTGSRNLPGSVIGDIPPEQQLGPADIRSYGVSSVSDLLTELAPQTTSGRGGMPVVLLNGRRISSFAEIRDLPTEAIARVDILPEEVALKYGYRADQKVVNFVLRRRFRALTLEAGDRIATEGGRNTPNGTLDILNINRDTRLSIHTGYTQSSALLESERDIAPIAGNTLDPRPFRTLLPFTRALDFGTVYARPIGKVSTTLNGTVAYSESNGLQGFAPNSDFVIGQRNTSMTYHLGGTANGDFGSAWRWSLTSNYDRVDSQTFTDAGTVGVPAANRGFSTSNTGEVNALVNGTLFKLPAGNVSTAIRVGGSLSRLDSRSSRFGINQSGSITRNVANGQINLDVPIASKSKDVLAFIGDLSINGNFALDSVSDFSTLKTIGYGVNWSPINAVRVIASMIDQDEAPSATQLGAPVIVTPNVRIFDYVTGQTVTVSSTSGGNPFLLADTKHSFRLGLTIKPLEKTDLTLTASYVNTSVRNATASFPAATAAIEAAFPSRFTRVNGTLTAIDARPVNFARTESSELRWGINFSKPLKSKLQKQIEAFRAGTGPDPRPALAGLRNLGNSQSVFGGTLSQGFRGRDGQGGQNNPPPPPANGQPPADGAPPPANATGGGQRGGGGFGGRGGGGGGRFGGGGPGGGGGRLNFALYHTWHFTDRVEIAPGVPVIDLLNGGAIGSGGQPRHELEAQAGYSNNGLGLRLSVNWQSGTRVDGGTIAAPTTLNFSSLATANLRLFFDPTTRLDLIAKHKWLIGTRFVVSVDNLFDSRQRVRDAAGNTPISYQPDYLDPLGRTIRIGIRKLLF